MDEAGGEAPRARRWLVVAAAALLTAGVVTAGVTSRDAPSEVDVVTAAGRTPGVVEVGPTVTLPPPAAQPPTEVPTTVLRPSTTLPKAAVAVLNAIASTVPPTTQAPQAAPSTTVVPGTSTTTAPAQTTTTVPPVLPRATFILVNQHPQMILLAINGRVVELAPGGAITAELPLALNGSTPVRVQAKEDISCGVDGPSRSFQAGGQYRITIVVGPTACARFAAPALDISPSA